MIKPSVYTNYQHAGLTGDHGHEGHGAVGEHINDTLAHVGDHADHAVGFVSGFTIPGLLELGTFLGFLALFMYMAFLQLSKARMIPKNDPYIGESVHHHV